MEQSRKMAKLAYEALDEKKGEIKEKTPKLSEHEQHGIRLHLEEILFRDICAKFPDMHKKPSCSADILRKELSFLYR